MAQLLDCWKGFNAKYDGQNKLNGQKLDDFIKITTRMKSSTFVHVECDMKDLMTFN